MNGETRSLLRRTGAAADRGTCWKLWGVVACTLLSSACISAGPLGADIESDLNHRWRGAWVVVKVNSISGCSGSYTNNEVHGGLVSARTGERFSQGELAVLHKVNVTRKRLEVFLDLDEPVLLARQDGPFTLYDEKFCKVELRLDLGSRDGRALAPIESLMESVLQRHEDERSARDSESWNRRVREPYPEDYDQTLAEYENWKAFQINAEVQAELDESIDEAARLLNRLSVNPEYLEGFGAGVDDARDSGWGQSCDQLVSMTDSSRVRRPDKGASGHWKKGYDHGQRLVFHLERARRLRRCFVPPPGL